MIDGEHAVAGASTGVLRADKFNTTVGFASRFEHQGSGEYRNHGRLVSRAIAPEFVDPAVRKRHIQPVQQLFHVAGPVQILSRVEIVCRPVPYPVITDDCTHLRVPCLIEGQLGAWFAVGSTDRVPGDPTSPVQFSNRRIVQGEIVDVGVDLAPLPVDLDFDPAVRDLLGHEPVEDAREEAVLDLLGRTRKVQTGVEPHRLAERQEQDALGVALAVAPLDRFRCLDEVAFGWEAEQDVVPDEPEDALDLLRVTDDAIDEIVRCLLE